MYPATLKKNIIEFPQSSYLGAIPISINTIIIGIVSYYDYRNSARWAAFAIWCISVVLSTAVGVGLVTIQTMRTPESGVSDVAGIWLMTTVPLFTLASAGSTLLPYLNGVNTKAAITVLVISFLAWSWAISLLTFILAIYLFRLLAYKLPGPQLLASSFLPCAALSQAAFSILRLAIFLASYIRTGYAPTQVEPPPNPESTLLAVASVIHWIGILMSLGILGCASFWLFQATCAFIYAFPKTFNISLWSLVFPWASYAGAWNFIARDLRNDGMRGWGATHTVIATLLWVACALPTAYLGFWKGSLFVSPGLEKWLPEGQHGRGEGGQEGGEQGQAQGQDGSRKHSMNGTYTFSAAQAGRNGAKDAENGSRRRQPNGSAQADG